jgi:hypothetical protein
MMNVLIGFLMVVGSAGYMETHADFGITQIMFAIIGLILMFTGTRKEVV